MLRAVLVLLAKTIALLMDPTDAAYLNGYLLDQTLNTRQLPDVLKTTKASSPNAVWLTYTYDARRKIASVSDSDGQGANEGRTYGYDANGPNMPGRTYCYRRPGRSILATAMLRADRVTTAAPMRTRPTRV